jgi:hypothetical protein
MEPPAVQGVLAFSVWNGFSVLPIMPILLPIKFRGGDVSIYEL